MDEKCAVCGYAFYPESGHMIGSYMLNYSFCTLFLLPLFGYLGFAGYSSEVVVGIPLLVLAILEPFVLRFSRLAWIHLHYKVAEGE